jgi:hypothetical protein
MNLPEQISAILRPHTVALGNAGAAQATLIRAHLVDIYDAIGDMGRPDFNDKWQYQAFSFAGAAGPIDFPTPVIVPNNEAWLVQLIMMTQAGAASIVIATDGGQVRGAFNATGPSTLSLGGNLVWLPGEHILITASAACVGTVGIIRKQMPAAQRPRAVIGNDSNEMVSGRSNTHEVGRDNLDQKGIYTEPPGEVRAGEGLERGTAPAIPYTEARETTQTNLVLDPTAP